MRSKILAILRPWNPGFQKFHEHFPFPETRYLLELSHVCMHTRQLSCLPESTHAEHPSPQRGNARLRTLFSLKKRNIWKLRRVFIWNRKALDSAPACHMNTWKTGYGVSAACNLTFWKFTKCKTNHQMEESVAQSREERWGGSGFPCAFH